MKQVLEMLQLQQQLNDSTNGTNWENGLTKNSKVINWKRCIYMECAEMIDSFAWKHWKNIEAEPDWANLKIEVVDVWHFVMSLVLSEYKVNNFGTIEDIAKMIENMDSYKALQTDKTNYGDIDDIMGKIELLMLDVLSINEFFPKKLIKNFFELTKMSGLNLDSLYQLYVGKNILNQFRQDNGYKDGSYIKIWNNKEDNIVMKELWEQNSELSPSQLYDRLKEAYPKG